MCQKFALTEMHPQNCEMSVHSGKAMDMHYPTVLAAKKGAVIWNHHQNMRGCLSNSGVHPLLNTPLVDGCTMIKFQQLQRVFS